jgi:hypothetical protein
MSGRIVSDIIEFKDALDSFLDENEMHLLILRGEERFILALVEKDVKLVLVQSAKIMLDSPVKIDLGFLMNLSPLLLLFIQNFFDQYLMEEQHVTLRR